MLFTVSPFDPITGELLPVYRDAYLRGDLPATPAQEVEAFLKKNPVQTRVALARWHQLAAQEKAAQRPPLVSPPWLLEQLAQQAIVSAWGPLRRPIVQVVLGIALLLTVASVVQWIRHKPLVPAPVVASLQRAAKSVTQTTRRLAGLSPAKEEEPIKEKKKVVRRPALVSSPKPAPAAKPQPRRPAPTEPLEARVIVPLLTTTAPTVATAAPEEQGPIMVQGRITDEQGHALPGATVLVQGTRQATSANANGVYSLEVPAGAVLQFGYAGYTDQLVKRAGSTLNITLAPLRGVKRPELPRSR